MHAFDVLGVPVRRRILELLADREVTSGAICAVIQDEFGISQPAVSQHLRVLRESGFATARADGARRLYAVKPQPLQEVDQWLERFRRFWAPHLDALSTELVRGRREPPRETPREQLRELSRGPARGGAETHPSRQEELGHV